LLIITYQMIGKKNKDYSVIFNFSRRSCGSVCNLFFSKLLIFLLIKLKHIFIKVKLPKLYRFLRVFHVFFTFLLDIRSSGFLRIASGNCWLLYESTIKYVWLVSPTFSSNFFVSIFILFLNCVS